MTDALGVNSTTKDQAQQAAGTAADEGRHVASVAADEARSVAGEAQAHAKGLLDEALTQVDGQTRVQRDRVATTLQTISDDLETMASGADNGLATDLARQAAGRARTLGQHLDGRDPADLLADVRGFARQRPGTFLAGALIAGVVVGRLARGAKDAGTSSTTGSTPAERAFDTGNDTGIDMGSNGGSRPYGEPTVASPTIAAPVPQDNGLGINDPAVGAAVPPHPTGRYEP